LIKSFYKVKFNTGNRCFTLYPLSIVMAENIDAMREWAKDRTVSANWVVT